MYRRKNLSVWQIVNIVLIVCAALALLVAVAVGLSAGALPSFGTVVSLGTLALMAAITLYTFEGKSRFMLLCLIYCLIYGVAALSVVSLMMSLTSR